MMPTNSARKLVLALAISGLLSTLALAQRPAPVVEADLLGFAPDRLGRIDALIGQYVAESRIAGAVTLVARHGKVAHLGAAGKRDVEQNAPMAADTIFRIASMSKAVTSVAVMMLMEDGRLLISDPVSRYIPAFAKTTVIGEGGAADRGIIATTPASRPITIRDLLTHTAGINYGGGPAESQYKAAKLFGWYFADKDETIGTAIDRLATLPFAAQPGDEFVYGYSTDVLGSVVERVSGMTLDAFMTSRIFTPLRMSDTFFFVPREKAGRLAAVYSADENGKIQRAPDAGTGQGAYVVGPRRCFSGGAGLLSTASDYARFLQMLLNGGELDGVRLLGPKTIELMTRNHVGALYQKGQFGFGLGFELTEHVGRAGRSGSVGEFGWGGAYYTRFIVDPTEDLIAVFMAQLLPARNLDLQLKFRAAVYQAIVKSEVVSPHPGRALP